MARRVLAPFSRRSRDHLSREAARGRLPRRPAYSRGEAASGNWLVRLPCSAGLGGVSRTTSPPTDDFFAELARLHTDAAALLGSDVPDGTAARVRTGLVVASGGGVASRAVSPRSGNRRGVWVLVVVAVV